MVSEEIIRRQLDKTVDQTDFPGLGELYKGKVRDCYTKQDRMIIITTDRISAFDRVLGTIPFKGQVLTQFARFWFEKTRDIVTNHIIDVPDPNVMIVKKADALPVEMVIRAYITGVTTTSAWYNYEKGIRNFCGNMLPDGLKKDQKLPEPIITPSTKAEHGDHDESVSADQIVQRGLLSRDRMDQLGEICLKLFDRGAKIAAAQGIILVDTKYEFGLDPNGNIMLIDEIHTPDSSRFWYFDTYDELFEKGLEQRKIDKEYVRKWLADQGFRGEGEPPVLTDEVRIEAAKRYIQAFEQITGTEFSVTDEPAEERIAKLISTL